MKLIQSIRKNTLFQFNCSSSNFFPLCLSKRRNIYQFYSQKQGFGHLGREGFVGFRLGFCFGFGFFKTENNWQIAHSKISLKNNKKKLSSCHLLQPRKHYRENELLPQLCLRSQFETAVLKTRLKLAAGDAVRSLREGFGGLWCSPGGVFSPTGKKCGWCCGGVQ